MSALHLHPQPGSSSTASKPVPKFPSIQPSPVFTYRPSPDGIDTNLMIVFHGLGDTQSPYASLGPKLNLPQTAWLSLRAFERVPLLEEDAFQWWNSFDVLTGAPVQHPNPTSTLTKLIEILETLVAADLGWHPERIHLFGFAQGGSCAAELALMWARRRPSSPGLGSLVTVSGPLLSLPTIAPDARSSTPVLLWTRKGEDPLRRWCSAFDRGFKFVQQHVSKPASPEQMPRTPEEWQPILQFWSKLLKSRHPWETDGTNSGESIYEVKTTH